MLSTKQKLTTITEVKLDRITEKESKSYKDISKVRRISKDTKSNEKWHNLNWKEINQKVEDMQEDLVKAVKEGDNQKIASLQRILVTSFEGRAKAVRKVVTNSGGKTSGVDRIIWADPGAYYQAITDLGKIVENPKEYRAKPLRRVLIPKPGKKEMRGLGIPTLTDRTVQAVYHLAVDPIVECNSDMHSFGFRKRKSTQDAVNAIAMYLSRKIAPKWILEADISKCFDKIDHGFLMEHTPICDKAVLEQWLKSGVMENSSFKPTEEGTPQGGIISPTLCNVALNGMEERIKQTVKKRRGISPGIKVVRYADDVVITGKSEKILKKCKDSLIEFLKPRGLELNNSKTTIKHVKEGFDFLGFNIRRQKSTEANNSDQEEVLIVKPSKKGIQRIRDKIRTIIIERKWEKIVYELNPVLRGWAEHKRITPHAKKVFNLLDHYVWQRMRTIFIRSKHGRRNVHQNYAKFYRVDPRRTKEVRNIFKLSSVASIRLTLMKMGVNPYTTEGRAYYDKMREERVLSKLKQTVYGRYNQKCQICQDSLHNGERVELHHIKPTCEGGKTVVNNLMPLHWICHLKITHDKSIKWPQ